MNINFTPRNIFKGKNSNGTSFTVEEWDFGTIANFEIAHLLVMIALGFAIGSVISPILLAISLIFFKGRAALLHIIGVIFSGYFLIDCYNDWIGIMVVYLFCDEPELIFIVALNFASLLTHASLVFFVSSLPKTIIIYIITISIFLVAFKKGEVLAPKFAKERLEVINDPTPYFYRD
jgi:hypothetical protein